MVAALVQNNGPGSGSSTVYTQAFASNVASGNLLIATGSGDPHTATETFTDSRSNAYTALTQRNDTTNTQALGAAWAPSGSAGSCTVTLTFGAAAVSQLLAIAEFSGVDTASAHASNGVASQAATTTPSTGSITTTVRCLVISVLNATSLQSVTSAPSGFTLLSSSSNLVRVAYAVLDGGTYNPQWTTASGRYNGDTIAFAETADAQATPPRIRVVQQVAVSRSRSY